MRWFEPLVRSRIAASVFAAVIVTAGLATRGLSAEESRGLSLKEIERRLNKLKDGEVDKDEKQCGISCLYLFLKMQGVDAKFSKIQELVPIGEHGASLHDLAQASQKLGLRARPVFCGPTDLASLRLPAIAHLERFTEATPYLHYVVITGVTERGVDLFDPFDSGVRFYNRSQLGTVFSGYFLVPAPRPALRPATILGALGLLLTGLGMWRIARTRREGRLEGEKVAPLPAGGVLFVAAVFCCLPGCGRERPSPGSVAGKEPAGSVAGQEPVSAIDVESTVLDLGQLEWKSSPQGEFRFRNRSSAPVKLRLGPTDCACSKATLEPKDVLAPGAEGRLSLQVDLAQKTHGGRIETCAILLLGDNENGLKFCMKGVLEGIVFPEEMYVIRPEQRRGGAIPDLRFGVVTHGLPDLKITKITCVSLEDYPKMLTKERDRLHTELVDSRAPLTAELAKATVLPPKYEAGDACNVRGVDVPMRLEGLQGAYTGLIIVDYLINKKEMQASTKVLVVGSDAG